MSKPPQKNQTKPAAGSNPAPVAKPVSIAEAAPARKSTASTPAAPRERSTTFVLVAPDAKQVTLCGEFNGWSPKATPMHRQKDGRWSAQVPLQPGRYQYKFVADGQWLHDPTRETVANEHGSLNSVVVVAP